MNGFAVVLKNFPGGSYSILLLYSAKLKIGNVNKSAVKKHTKKKLFCELNLFFGVERSETEKNRFGGRH